MKQPIARIRLNPGQGGFFDPVTRIHLTHGDPVKDIYAGMNTEGLKAAIRSKRISLISGSLGASVAPFKLIRRQDGKVVIVPNKSIPEPVQDTGSKKIQPKKQKSAAVQSVTAKKADLATTPNVLPQQEEPVEQELSVVQEPPTVQKPVVLKMSETTKEQETITVPEPVIVEKPKVDTPVADSKPVDITVTDSISVNALPETSDIADNVTTDIIEQEEPVVTGNDSQSNSPFRRNKKNKKRYNDN